MTYYAMGGDGLRFSTVHGLVRISANVALAPSTGLSSVTIRVGYCILLGLLI